MKVIFAIWLVAWLSVCRAQLTNDFPLPADFREASVNPLTGRLYVASRDVQLYSRRQTAGELPSRTVVEAMPTADAHWLQLRYNGRIYEADAAAFVAENNLLQDLTAREAELQTQHQALSAEFQSVRDQVQSLEKEAHWWEASTRKMMVVFPAPPSVQRGITNSTGSEIALVTDDMDVNRAAVCRRDLRKLSRRCEKLEQQMASLEMELARMSEIRTLVEQRFSDYRLAYQRP